MRALIRTIVAGVTLAIGVPILAGGTILASFVFMPLPAVLPQPTTPRLAADPSVVYDDQGNVIAAFTGVNHDVPVPDSQIPPIVKEAVISSEDRNFYHEGGVSLRGSARAFYQDLFGGGGLQGGSTITQQYVKLAYTNGQRTVMRKLHEAVLASEVSRQLSKEQILYRYLSGTYFGEGAYGVGAAALGYFRTPVSNLDASQAATLAGVIPAPTDYDPLVDLAAAEQRRETVLGKMRNEGYLTPAQYEQAMDERLTLAQDMKPGVAATAVYPPAPQSTPYPYFVDYVRQWLLQRLSPDQLYGGGLRIQTTIDPADEAKAENAINSTLSGTNPPVDMALASVDPTTGYVKALVGGRSYSQLQVDLALGGCPPRPTNPAITVQVPARCWDGQTITGGGGGEQPGSGFKMFDLVAALEAGVPLSRVYNGPTSITLGGTTFHNSEGEGGGYYDLRQATAQSINTVFVQLARDVGMKPIVQTAKSMGISSAYLDSAQGSGLAISIGAEEVAPLEMASAYGVLANQGNRVQPSPVVRVEDPTGKLLIDDSHPSAQRVVPANIAGQVTQVLQGVTAPGGTGYPNAVIGRPQAGKTGTTDACANAWFNGYTPQLSTTVWMGHDDQTKPLSDIDGLSCVYGGTLPAKAWASYMSSALAGQPALAFTSPPPPTTVPQDVIESQQRGGFDPGDRQYPTYIGSGGTYVYSPPGVYATPPPTVPPPTVAPPPTPTTTTSTSTTTTSTPTRKPVPGPP